MSDGLRNRIFSGVVWSIVARLGQQIMQFGLSVILARLLLPSDFGVIGMISVFTAFVGMFADIGFGSALVQRSEVTEQHIQSVFWFSLATGLLLSSGVYLAAPMIAAFYDEPVLTPLTRGLSPVFIISTAGMVPSAMMQRRMQFNRLAPISLIATFLSGLIGVTLAYLGAEVWSLVAQSLSNHLIITVLNWVYGKWYPRILFSLEALKELYRYTINLLGFTFTNYWARNLDNMLVGRFFGSSALGYYGRAYGLMLLPINQVISVITQVMFPALSNIKDDKMRVKSLYLRAISVISLFTFPMMTGLFVVAKPFIITVFGEQWMGTIRLLQILALVGAVQSLVNPTGWLYMSQGRTDWLFRWGLIRTGLVIIAIASGILLGSVETVAVCYAIVNLLLLYPDIIIPGRLVNIEFRDLILAILGPLIGSVAMGGAVYGLDLLLPYDISYGQELSILIIAGILIYGVFVIGLRLPAWLEISNLLHERLGSRS